MSIKLSVLDQTPVRKGSNAVLALQETVELAKLTDRLGYSRYWISEHHNTILLATAAPEVLLARLGAETKNIRLGSGGIMLPNHSSLKVAENFRLLEALYPNRIDLGIGRAPGGDRPTSQLLNPANQFDPQGYVDQVREIGDFFHENPSIHNLNGKIIAIPSIDTAPDLWILTSSGESAYLAAHFGTGLSYAQFINPVGGPDAIRIYKEKFIPSEQFSEPQTNVGIFVFCSENEQKVEEARHLMNYRFLSFENGNYNKVFSYADIKDYEYSPAEKQRLTYHQQRFVAGTPAMIKNELGRLAANFDTEEIVIATFADSKEDRFHSYELLADIFLNAAEPNGNYTLNTGVNAGC